MGEFTIPADDEWTIPSDVVVVVALFVLLDAVSVWGSSGVTAVRALVGLPALLFVPGYLLVAILFPRRELTEDPPDAQRQSNEARRTVGMPIRARTIGWRERIALSFGMSVALVPLLGFVVAPVAGSLAFEPVLLGLTAYVLVGAVTAVVRRNHVPEDDRLRVPFRRWRASLRSSFGGRPTRTDTLLGALLIGSAIVAVSVTGFALLAPQEAEAYTSTALLTEDGDGELVASGYPSELAVGSDAELVLQVGNHEGVETTYTVVAELQRVETGGDSTTVLERDRLLEDRETVDAGDTWLLEHTVNPSMAGSDLRLTYYVFRGEPPANPDAEGAYRTAYIWVDVIRPGDSG